MRVIAGPAYGLRRERVIGSEVQIQAVDDRLVRTAITVPMDDGPGKTVHLWDRTGTQPVLAAGNAAGDTAARFALVVHNDDDVREYAYDNPQILNAAAGGLDGDQHAGRFRPRVAGESRRWRAVTDGLSCWSSDPFQNAGMVSASQHSWLSCPCA